MEKPVKKNEEHIVNIIDNGYSGEGIAKIDNFTIFIPGAIKGEKIKILIVKVMTSNAFGKILEIIESSDKRVIPDCATYKRCGGCNLRHIQYGETLNIKRYIVQNLVNKTLKTKIQVNSVIGMKDPYHYRNKAQYPIGKNKNGEKVIGVFASRTHEIIPMNGCAIQKEISEEIAKYILEFIKEKNISVYDEKAGKGIFRHIVIRIGVKTNEIMCILVINSEKFDYESELIEKLINKYPNIKTIIKNVNKKNTNVILGDKNINIYGNGYITDILSEYKFKISPMSFYQTNPTQTEILYNLAIEKANLNGNETIFDLYCGIGAIGIFVSKYVKKVYGIEIVKEAIEDAKENSKINNITNSEFIAGDVETALTELIEKRKITADAIFVDPPRKGLDNKTIENILKIKPKKIIYISCNPATLMRDLSEFEQVYDILDIQPVDMFPFTRTHRKYSCFKIKINIIYKGVWYGANYRNNCRK